VVEGVESPAPPGLGAECLDQELADLGGGRRRIRTPHRLYCTPRLE